MLLNAKINFKKYTYYTLILLALTAFSLKSIQELGAVIIVTLATCLNQWMLVKAVRLASVAAASEKPAGGVKIIILALGKIVILFGALSFGVHIMGNRIIIPLLFYVLQIGVLYLSFEKTQ